MFSADLPTDTLVHGFFTDSPLIEPWHHLLQDEDPADLTDGAKFCFYQTAEQANAGRDLGMHIDKMIFKGDQVGSIAQ